MKPIDELFMIINGVPSSNVKIFDCFEESRIKYTRPSNTYKGTHAGFVNINEVSPDKIFSEETLFMSTDGEGSHTYSYVSTENFIPNSNIAVLIPKENLTLQEKIYYAVCITINRYRFNYGRKPKGNRLKCITLPEKYEIPVWVNSESTHNFKNANKAYQTKSITFDTKIWKPFKIEELFDFKKGKRLIKTNMKFGETPFIGSIDKNNTYREYVSQKPIHTGNTITVNYNGSVAEAFYQPKPFWASDDINVLYPKFQLNQYIGMFLVTIIRHEKYRFNYGRKWHLERMKESVIKLPVTDKATPDWQFMENYIKSLPYSKVLEQSDS